MIISEILAIIFMVVIGYVIIKRYSLLPNTPDLFLLPYAFGLGSGLAGMQLYVYSRLHIPWHILYLLLPWGILVLVLLLTWQKDEFAILFTKPKFALLEGFLVIILVILIAFVAFEAIIRPVSAWDSWAIWLLKAKIFFTDGYINPQRLVYVESGYPILLSLSATYNYLFMGGVNDQYVLLFFFAFYLFLGLSFYANLRNYTGKIFALFMTFLLLSAQNILRHGGRYEAGQADLATAFYLFICTTLFYRLVTKMNKNVLILLNLLLGIAALIKNEGLFFSIFIQILLCINIIRTKQYKLLLFSIIWLVPVLDWQIYKTYSHVPDISTVFIGKFTNIQRVIPVAIEMVREFINIKNWNLLWIFFFSIIPASLTLQKPHKIWILYLLFFLQLGLYYVIYLVFPSNPIVLVDSSFNRLLIHLAPLALYISAIECYRILHNNSSLERQKKKNKI